MSTELYFSHEWRRNLTQPSFNRTGALAYNGRLNNFNDNLGNVWGINKGNVPRGLTGKESYGSDAFYIYKPTESGGGKASVINGIGWMRWYQANAVDSIGLALRYGLGAGDGRGYYTYTYNNSAVFISGFQSGGGWLTNLAQANFTVGTGYRRMTFYAYSASSASTALRCIVTDDAGAVLADATASNNNASLQSNATFTNGASFGFYSHANYNFSGAIREYQVETITGLPAIISRVRSAATGIRLESEAYLGVGALSFVKWEYSTNANSGWADLPGGTTNWYTWTGMIAGVEYYFRPVWADAGSGGAQSTGNVVSYTWFGSPIVLFFGGDSWGEGDATGDGATNLETGTIPEMIGLQLEAMTGREVAMYNGGKNGLTASAYNTTHATTELAAAVAQGATHAVWMFGLNFEASVAAFQTAMAALVTKSRAQNLMTFVQVTPAFHSGGRAGRGNDLIDVAQQYGAVLQNNVIDGVNVFPADRKLFEATSAWRNFYYDCLHMGWVGKMMVASRIARGMANILDPVPGERVSMF